MNQLDIQIVSDADNIPDLSQFQRWADQVLPPKPSIHHEIVIRIVDDDESAQLNQQYRHKQGPTNILSFPFQSPPGIDMELLGDLVICAPVLVKEAHQQHKRLHDHWAHITVHGILHLLGYDHINEDEALMMESMEIEILQTLNIANPYQENIKS